MKANESKNWAKYKIISGKATGYVSLGSWLYASTLKSAQSMAKYYNGKIVKL